MNREELRIHVTNDPAYMENAFTLSLRDGGPCWIIDPGLQPQAQQISAYIREHDLKPEAILLTHGHLDHIAGVDELRQELTPPDSDLEPLPVLMAREEWAALSDPKENLSGAVGFPVRTEVTDPRDLIPDQTLKLDGTAWKILDTSGHSPGGRSFYCEAQQVVFVGDALFSGSVGRVDFHHSSAEQLLRNLHAQLMSLPDETRVLCGHGPDTTIGRERKTNPYITQGLTL